ncbi:MAG: hypothetical protein JWO45_1649, partial [Spartobacteria bacterium]|nr:hypothetical protein [Spartobacteria bacterium]
MSPSSFEPADLLDLKLVPSWVKESGGIESYAHYKGDEEAERPRGRDDRGPGRDRRPKKHPGRPSDKGQERRGPRRDGARKPQRPQRPEVEHRIPEAPLEIAVRFLPGPAVLENVVAQIQSDALAYSLFHLARL